MQKVLIVTGAAGGIGAAIVRKAIPDWQVCINYRSDSSKAEALLKEIKASGGEGMICKADVSKEADVLHLFDAVEKQLGTVTGLVNNAAVTGGASSVVEVTYATLQSICDTNIIGAYLCAREAVKRMATDRGGQGGGIVNIGSIAARLGAPGLGTHYAMSKGAIEAFGRSLAAEVAGVGIRVNTVSPGVIDTDMHASVGLPNRPRDAAAVIPIKRAGTAAEVADAVLWLLSDQASYIAGSVVEVSGGR